jgi:UDP-N-acetylglucosamine 4-epimerase
MFSTQKKWLITGVAGFIGSHLLKRLLEENQYVVGVDNFSTGFQHNIDEVLAECTELQRKNFEFYQGDILDYPLCLKITEGISIVLHQAALGSVPRSIVDPMATHNVNVNGTLNLLEAARKNNVGIFIYASSSSVYGDSPLLPKQEDTVGNLLSPYALSKYTNELYADIYHRCYNMKTLGLRYFNVFGPRQNTTGPYSAVIPTWIMALMKGEPLYINGDGSTSRDFTFIDNIVQLNMKAVEGIERLDSHQVYNGGARGQTSLKDLLTLIKEEFKDSPSIVHHQDFRMGDVRHSFADISKAKKDLNYLPSHSIKEGIALTVKWFKNRYSSLSV